MTDFDNAEIDAARREEYPAKYSATLNPRQLDLLAQIGPSGTLVEIDEDALGAIYMARTAAERTAALHRETLRDPAAPLSARTMAEQRLGVWNARANDLDELGAKFESGVRR